MLLIRSGVTDWHEQGKLIGRRDRPLSDKGLAQAESLAEMLDEIPLGEIVCSPLQRAVQTGQILERRFGLDMARDQRLSALALGEWEGRTLEQLAEEPLYEQFLARPTDVRLPGGEGIEAARRRAVAAVEQAISDAAAGDILAVITHSTLIRMVLGHYMGAPVGSYQRMQVDPGSVSVVSFGHGGAARVTAINWRPPLTSLLGMPGIS